MNSFILFLILLFIFLALKIPVFISLGLSAMGLGLIQFGTIFPQVVIQKMYTGLDSFTILAIPLFMLTGELMNTGSLSKRLINFANSLVGWITGGLGFVVTLTCVFLGAILGSSSACSAMIGAILIPAMVSKGYNKTFSSALVASSGGIGAIIPPSGAMLVYAVTASVSVAKLFAGGYGPGIMVAAFFMLYTYIIAKKEGYPAEEKPTVKAFFISIRDAIIPLLLPVIIMGSILGGVCTATESAAIAVMYCLIIGLFIYRDVKIKDLPGIFVRAAKSTCMVLIVMSTANFLSYMMTVSLIPQTAAAFVMSLTQSRVIFLFMCMGLFLIAGCFLEASCSILILCPVLLPIARAFDIDLAFFGVLIVINLMIGVLTPPVGLNLYVTASISGIDILRLSKAVMPFILLMLLAILLMILFPQIVMFIPNVLKL